MAEIILPGKFMATRNTAAAWTAANSVLHEGEIGVETDTRKGKIGDGKTPWNELDYAFGDTSGGDTVDLAVSGDGLKITVTKADGTVQTGTLSFGTLSAKVAVSDTSTSKTTTRDVDLGAQPLEDGVYVYGERNGTGKAVLPDEWGDLDGEGYEAVGVVVVEDGHAVMVAVEEPDGYMDGWGENGTYGYDTGGTMTDDESEAREDWAGSTNTLKAYSYAGSHDENGSNYAICYAHTYAKGSKGAGIWHLPAAAEAVLIANHFDEINEALDTIGATELQADFYWTSTQYDEYYAWGMYLYDGNMFIDFKDIGYHRARAVTAFSI